MEVKNTPTGWFVSNHDIKVVINTITNQVARGTIVEDTYYGSEVIISKNERILHSSLLPVTDFKLPSVKGGLVGILKRHLDLITFGVYGSKDRYSNGDVEQEIIYVLRMLDSDFFIDFKDEVRIPIWLMGKLHWTVFGKDGSLFKATRKKVGSYYETTITKTKESYIHPSNERAPDLNISNVKTEITVLETEAGPLQFTWFENLF